MRLKKYRKLVDSERIASAEVLRGVPIESPYWAENNNVYIGNIPSINHWIFIPWIFIPYGQQRISDRVRIAFQDDKNIIPCKCGAYEVETKNKYPIFKMSFFKVCCTNCKRTRMK